MSVGGGGGMPDASVGNNPAHNRREGSSTFLPGHGASTTTKAGEYNNPASPTGRGGRKFRPALPPAHSPPKVFERLPAASTYYGSTTGLVAPRMPPPAENWPPPPVPPDEGVSAQSEREAKEGQVMRRLRKKLVHKYGDWRGCFKVGDRAPGMVSCEQIAAFLHHRNVLLTPDEHKVASSTRLPHPRHPYPKSTLNPKPGPTPKVVLHSLPGGCGPDSG
jgi:hypothetical protein